MHPRVEQIGRFLILLLYVALPHDAPEADLDVLARAAEAVVEIEVAEGGIEIVAPHQSDRAFTEPDAFGPGSRPGHDAARLGNLIDASGAILGFGLALLGRLRLGILRPQRGGRERRRTKNNCKGTPNNTDHDRTIGFRSGLTGTGILLRKSGRYWG